MEAKVLTWDEFRELCKEDAYNWFNNGNSANELTKDDIVHEYPDNYFSDNTESEHDDLSSAFTPSEFAKQTIEYLEEIESEVNKNDWSNGSFERFLWAQY